MDKKIWIYFIFLICFLAPLFSYSQGTYLPTCKRYKNGRCVENYSDSEVRAAAQQNSTTSDSTSTSEYARCRAAGGIWASGTCQQNQSSNSSGTTSGTSSSPSSPRKPAPKPNPKPSPKPKNPTCVAGATYSTTLKKCVCDVGGDISTGCKVTAEPAGTTQCPANQSFINGKCMCSVNGSWVEPQIEFQSGRPECPVPLDYSQTSSTNNNMAQTTNESLYRCMDQMEKQVEKCQTEADEAKTSCNEKTSNNKSLADYKNALNQTNGAMTASQSGSGAAAQCAKAGLISSTGVYAINSTKEDCEEDYGQCVNTCDAIDTNKINQCLMTIRKDPYTGQHLPEDMAYFNKRFTQITSDLEEAKEDCKVEAKKEKDSLQELLQSLGQSAQQAKQCECQLNSGGTNCNAIPSPADCLPGGRLYGQSVCSTWNTGTKCLVGSADYNSKDCVCLRDPNNSICRSLNNNSVNPVLPNIQTGGTTVQPGGGTNGRPGIDIGSIKDDSLQEAIKDKQGNNGSAGFNTPSGDGAGGGSGSGAGGSGALAVGEKDGENGEADEKNLGTFGQLKSVVGSLFGAKKSNGFDSSNGRGFGRNGNGPDFEKWRPKGARSLASEYGIAARHTDIWTTMNHRYREKSSSLLGP